MVILGLTGSIAMGKSVAARMFAREGAAVFDADAVVHRLIGPAGAAVAEVAAAFSGCELDGARGPAIDRAALARQVFGDAAATARLEAILHPRVRAAEESFLRRSAGQRRRLVVLEVPLLFETGGDRRCDVVAVVSAPGFLQTQRALRRPGMTTDRLAAIRRRQAGDGEKLRRADFVIPTGLGRAVTLRRVRRIVTMLMQREADDYRRTAGHGAGKRTMKSARAITCGKSPSIRRQRVSIRRPATVSSKLAASNSPTTCQQAASSSVISIPSATCPSRRFRCTGFPPNS